MRHLLAAIALAALSACGFIGADRSEDDATAADRMANSTTQNLADTMASDDEGLARVDPALAIADPEARPVMQAQVVLDRLGFGPGVIDGEMGLSTRNALMGFQEANKLLVTGELDDTTRGALDVWNKIPATRVVRIPQEWAEIAFAPIPDDPAEQAKLERMGYTSLDEKLAERFHTTIDVLVALNPGGRPAGAPGEATTTVNGQGTIAARPPSPSPTASGAPAPANFRPGQIVRVPNVGADRIAPGAVDDDDWRATLVSLGVGTEQPEAARIVVSKSAGTLRAYDGDGKLVALFTVTTGSRRDPLPLGEWQILATVLNPSFTYNPELFWDVPDGDAKQQLPPGPNGPVGVVWIDLSKEHYGIHGTPEPHTIGRAESHGCVRLTNWDVARLAQMVSRETRVLFEA
ncbi:L,D-transpeptidase family protein [Leptolyngbya sp. 15MV]|nr:L,D-transpeptidase family protein [Leptolyngbya sp. 15MV]